MDCRILYLSVVVPFKIVVLVYGKLIVGFCAFGSYGQYVGHSRHTIIQKYN